MPCRSLLDRPASDHFRFVSDRRQTAPALDGTYTIDAAMLLLAHSMLTFRRVNAKTIEIRALPRPADRAN